MQKTLVNNLQNELQPVFKHIEAPLVEQENIINFIEKVINNMYELIHALEDESDPQIKRVADIKKNKSYLDRYIDSFKLNLDYYRAIGDPQNIRFTVQSLDTFIAFKKDPDLVLNSFAEVNTFMLSSPDAKRLILLLKEQKNITPKEQEYIHKYDMFKNAQKISKFFEGYNVTRKGIVSSTSIHLFRSLSILEIPKHTLKDVLESIFICLGEKVRIYPDNMSGVYVKTIFRKVPIFAYPSKNEKASYYDFEKINEKIVKRILKNKERGNVRASDQLEKYFKSVILPLQLQMNPASFSKEKNS